MHNNKYSYLLLFFTFLTFYVHCTNLSELIDMFSPPVREAVSTKKTFLNVNILLYMHGINVSEILNIHSKMAISDICY